MIVLFRQLFDVSNGYEKFEVNASSTSPPTSIFWKLKRRRLEIFEEKPHASGIKDPSISLTRGKNCESIVALVGENFDKHRSSLDKKSQFLDYVELLAKSKPRPSSIQWGQLCLQRLREFIYPYKKLETRSLLLNGMKERLDPIKVESVPVQPWNIYQHLVHSDNEFLIKLNLLDREVSIAFPRNCTFFWGDVQHGLSHISTIPDYSSLFRVSNSTQIVSVILFLYLFAKVIVVDPPWPNRSVTRGGGGKYSSMDFEEIKMLGSRLCPLLDPSGCLCAVWVTNSPTVIRFAVNELLPAWGFEYLTTWLWLKIALDGEPVCPPESQHKKPVECAIIGFRGIISNKPPFAGGTTGGYTHPTNR